MVTRKKKADSTPEEWEAYLAEANAYYAANRERIRAARNLRDAMPEVKAARAIRDATPEAREKRRAKDKRGRSKLYSKVRNDPEAWAKRIQGQRKRRTGFSADDVAALMVIQNGNCAICECSLEERQVRADHCHDTGKPRGLLCHHCNIMEGMLRGKSLDPAVFAERLVNYRAHPPFLLRKGQGLQDPSFRI